MRARFGLVTAAAVLAAGLWSGRAGAAGGADGEGPGPTWPTNPYWVTSAPPNGPGHKVPTIEEMKKHCGDDVKIVIKTSRGGKTGFLGTYAVGDELEFWTAPGDANSKITINHKSCGGGKVLATFEWTDESGRRVVTTAQPTPHLC